MATIAIEIFPWNDNFDTGLPTIDAQQRKLVQTLNDLASHIVSSPESGLLDQVFDELSEYVASHFATEEAVWHEHLADDPAAIEHRAIHRSFVDELSRLDTSRTWRPLAEVAGQTIGFLARWLASHILGHDRQLAYRVLALQQGLAPAAAEQQAKERMTSATAALIDIILATYSTLSANALDLMRAIAGRQRDREELLRARQQLEASELDLRSFFDTIDDFLFVLDTHAEILHVNHAVLARLGHAEADLVGRSVLCLHPADTHEEAIRTIADMRAGTCDTCLIPLQTADGRLIAVETRVVAGQWKGRPALFGVSRDITEHRRREAERDRILALLDAAIEQSPSGILIADAPDVRIRIANPVALGIRGGERRLLTGIDLGQHGHRWQTFRIDGSPYPPEELPLSRAILSGQVTENEELIIRDENGQDHWVLANAAPIRRQGEIVAGIVIFHDISAHKQLERELAESKKVLEAVLDAVPVRIFWKDRDSRYLGCNPLFARDAGKSDPSELIGKDDRAMGWAEQAELYRADDRRVMESGVARLNFDEPQTTPDGRTIHLRTSKVPLRNDRGETFGVIGLYDDITEHKLAEEQRRSQLDELRRWQAVMLDREDRILDLKREVNELLARLHEPPRYASALASGGET